MLAFAQSYSQSQARLMFATTLEVDNFDCTKINVLCELQVFMIKRFVVVLPEYLDV